MSRTTPDSIIDERVRDMEPEDPNTLVDLKCKLTQTKFDVFLDEAQKFINEDWEWQWMTDAMAKSLTLREQYLSVIFVSKYLHDAHLYLVMNGSCVPNASMSMHYTGRLNVRFMVQKRQFRKSHEDEHYAAAVFQHLREYVIHCKDYSTMVCIDDKHRLKVGEPGFPVATAECGRKVIVLALPLK